jgi:hypothetical protein
MEEQKKITQRNKMTTFLTIKKYINDYKIEKEYFPFFCDMSKGKDSHNQNSFIYKYVSLKKLKEINNDLDGLILNCPSYEEKIKSQFPRFEGYFNELKEEQFENSFEADFLTNK